MLLYGRMHLAGSQSPFAQGMRELLGLEELGFAALKAGETASAGVYVNELTAGSVHVKGLFCTVGSGGVSAVSYTHLDVYKRQSRQSARNKRWKR